MQMAPARGSRMLCGTLQSVARSSTAQKWFYLKTKKNGIDVTINSAFSLAHPHARSSNAPHQNQMDQYDQQRAHHATWSVAPVAAVAPCRHHAQEQQYHQYDKNRSQCHNHLSVPGGIGRSLGGGRRTPIYSWLL